MSTGITDHLRISEYQILLFSSSA